MSSHSFSSPHLPHGGRHELGQNFLVDRRVIREVVALTARVPGPIVEFAAGQGALTLGLARLDRPLVAVEIDPRAVTSLRQRLEKTPARKVTVVHTDMLTYRPPFSAYIVVSNMPFHLTTPLLRRLLGLPRWRQAVLITQWEVARKRAGIGGATQLSAQWWPWYEFRLVRRIPAAAFRPRPSVDAGLLVLTRRATALLPGVSAGSKECARYQRWVQAVFTGSGRGLPQILARASGVSTQVAARWCDSHGSGGRTLPRNLTAEQWVAAYLTLEGKFS